MPGPGITIAIHSSGDAKAREYPSHQDEVAEKEQKQADEFGHCESLGCFRCTLSIVDEAKEDKPKNLSEAKIFETDAEAKLWQL